MGDLATDTALRPCGDGRFEATLSADWEIWGPMGGYVAAVRAPRRGRDDGARRPAIVLVPLPRRRASSARRRRAWRRASAVGRRGRNGSRSPRAIAPSSTRWCGASATTKASSTTRRIRPTCPGPTSLPSIQELLPDDAEPPFPVLAEPRREATRVRDRMAARRSATGALAGVAALPPDGDLRRSLGRRGALRHPRRPAELAVGAPSPRVEAAAVHRADARPERRVPPPDHRP